MPLQINVKLWTFIEDKNSPISPIESLAISTKSFYSGKSKTSPHSRASCRNLFSTKQNETMSPQTKSKQRNRRRSGSQNSFINRGVHHKIRKLPSNVGLVPKHYASIDIDQILNNVRNEKLRKLIMAKREEKQQIEKIHSIFRKASNTIAMARPLSAISNLDDTNNNLAEDDCKQHHPHKTSEPYQPAYEIDIDFSDIECEVEEDGVQSACDNLEEALMAKNEEVIPLITHQAISQTGFLTCRYIFFD